MARYTGAVCRLCRREGTKLFLKGTKCTSDRCPLEKRNFPPGQHGKDRKAKIVGYGLQLHEKQKAKRMYFTLESQFREYYEKASRSAGVTGELLIQQLERRLDNVTYRLGFAISRRQARQLLRHGHVTVNGRKVNIPSYQVNAGDVAARPGYCPRAPPSTTRSPRRCAQDRAPSSSARVGVSSPMFTIRRHGSSSLARFMWRRRLPRWRASPFSRS